MAVQLFPHNQKAYAAACTLLGQTGRAAVIHPTGTGKSYVAFAYIQDHPGERVLWLSPSEYIFKTQCEGLRREEPEFPLANVQFYTYAKLMLLSPAGLAALAPDLIILDEFHRCGAEQWGAGVQRLLAACPAAKVLGLSATNVRYLDNQRDMAEELFGGCVASEMTLGEAIVRGILPAPKYVTTVFRYQQELARYERRVAQVRGAGLKEQNQKYLDALRRALEKAEGLDKVFARHLTVKNGRYIVFCASVEHMREMIRQVPEWFAGVNPDVRVYPVYSDDPEAGTAFSDFKTAQNDSLKLLFCIDMLNEGVHVKDVSGVILFRPTISPTVYKQQIGRALTAGVLTTPLIVDVVNNFENLTSIRILQEEMRTAIQRMYRMGEGAAVVAESFEVVEQVRDCRELFEQLEGSLRSSWEQYFLAASEYAAEHGHLNVPKRYKSPGGLNLGEWITTQRGVYKGRLSGGLSEQQIRRLEGIGMLWDNRLEISWERNFAAARRYYEQHGDLLVPVDYVDADGCALGNWVANLRSQRANSEKRRLLSEDRIARLDSIGMSWDVISQKWEQNFREAEAYARAHGDLDVPYDYKTESGFALGTWICNLRATRSGTAKKRRPLREEQIRRLDALGMVWDKGAGALWNRSYAAARAYYEQHGDLNVPSRYVTAEGIALGKWITRQRYARQHPERSNAQMTPERIRLLDEIGMDWKLKNGRECCAADKGEHDIKSDAMGGT